MAPPHSSRVIVVFPTCPWVAGLCLSAMIGRFSFMAAVSKSFSGVQASEMSAILHKTRQRLTSFKRLGHTNWQIELLNYKLSYHWVQILPARVLWGISNSTNFISLHLALHAAKTCQDHEGQRHVKIWDETKDSGGMERIERKLPYICYIIYTYTNTRYIYNVYTEYNVWCIYIIFIYIYIL